MASQCSACGSATVTFAVPSDLRALAPSEAAHAVVCTRCLRTAAADEAGADPTTDEAAHADFSAIHSGVPGGGGGVAFALACGLLGSLALNRQSIQTLVEYAEREGVDVFLTLDRLASASADADATLDPHFDVHRRRTQIEQFL